MTTAELIAEGESLTLPAFYLREQTTVGETMAYWGGSRSDRADVFPPNMAYLSRRHICTISEGLLVRLDIANTGPVSLYEFEKNSDARELVHRADRDYRTKSTELSFSGLPLVAESVSSFPPFAALCYNGGEGVRAWLQSQSLAPHEYWRVHGEEREEYEKEWTRRQPSPNGDIVVVVGGWHFMWPDDNFYTPLEYRLLFLTFRDAQPWFEVWHSPCQHGFEVKERII